MWNPLGRPLPLPPLVLGRVALDIALICSWAWLASVHLPAPVAAFGAAAFGAASAWFWSSILRSSAATDRWTSEGHRQEQVERLSLATTRVEHETAALSGGVFLDRPVLELRREAALGRSGDGASLGIVYQRFNAGVLTDMATGSLEGIVRERFEPLVATFAQPCFATIMSSREAAVGLPGRSRQRVAAELSRLGALPGGESWDVGVAVFPEDHAEAAGLIELAILRARPLVEAQEMRQAA